MQYWHQSMIANETESRHLASEPHMRVEVMRIETKSTSALFDKYHGELLIVIWSGNATLHTASGAQLLQAGDQCLLSNGEPFKIEPEINGNAIVVQLIWSPGLSQCDKCEGI